MVDLSISLGELLHQLIQSTYHDLSQLSELLPTKSDIERKIQLTKFARKTNHQFVRLLALANWASSPETSNSLATFTAHLDQQSRIYIETADLLYLQEREELRGSELPQFCIVSAIDILRKRTFSFLPTCISKRLISLPPISESEKLATLHKLDQNLRLRLINLVPTLPYTLTPSLKLFPKGCLTMHVPHEFNAKLTLLSDDPSIPWRLIKLDFLVRDQRSFDTRPLLHSRQKLFLQYLVQSRLFKQDEDNVLNDAYQLLHSFCISLQLHVLYTQLIQLTEHWGKHNLEVEEYIPGEKLRLAYWCSSPMHLILDMLCSITISAIPSNPTLVYFHCDSTNSSIDKFDMPSSGAHSNLSTHKGKPLSSDQIFVDKLVHLCIENKCFNSLNTISKCLLDRAWPFSIHLRKSPPALILNLGFSDIPNLLVISKDPRNGKLQCIIFDSNLSPNYSVSYMDNRRVVSSTIQKYLDDLAKGLFDHMGYSAEFLTQFRAQYRIWHFEQQVVDMNMNVRSKLPLLNEDALPNITFNAKEKEKDSKVSSFYFRIFIKLQTPHHYLMLSVCPDTSSPHPGHLNESIFLLVTQDAQHSFYDNPFTRGNKNKLDSIEIGTTEEKDKSKLREKSLPCSVTSFLTISNIFHLMSDFVESTSYESLTLAPLQKRRMQSYGAQFVYCKKNEFISSSKLCDLIFNLDTLISIYHLQNALNQADCFEHFLVPTHTFSFSTRILILVKPPCPTHVTRTVYTNFCDRLSYCRFHLIPNQQWIIQFIFSSPLLDFNKSNSNLAFTSCCSGEVIYEHFSSDLESILMLYGPLVEFSLYLKSSKLLGKNCRIQSYTYTCVVILFCSEEQELNQGSLLDIVWNPKEKKFHLELNNSPHAFAQSSFEDTFNSNYSIAQLVFGLLKLFPMYRLIEQSTMNSRIKYQAGPNPGVIRLGFKSYIDFEICNNNKVIIHPQRHESTDRVFNLLDQFIDSFKVGDINYKDIYESGSLQIPAITRSHSLSAGSPGFPLRPYSPASKFSFSQTPFTASKSSPFFPSTFVSRTQQQFFPANGFEYTYLSSPSNYPTKTIHFATFKLLILPKKHYNPPLANFLAAAHQLDYERLVKYGTIPSLDSSRIKLESNSFCILFDNITVSVFLEANFMDLGIKLCISDNANAHDILKEQDILALENLFHSSKIKSPMFSSNALCCYLILMSSTANLIQTAAFIFRHSRNIPNDWLWQPELCLTVPDNSKVMPADDDLNIKPGTSCLYCFPSKKSYILYLRFLPKKQDHGLILDLVLLYDCKQNRVDLKTYGISNKSFDLVGNSVRQILTKVNSSITASNNPDCPLMLAVKEISKNLEI